MLDLDESSHSSGTPSARAKPRATELTVDNLRQAAEWYATLGDAAASKQEHDAWNVWLAQSTANAKAWEHIQSVSQKFAPLRHSTASSAAAIAGVTAARRALTTRRHVLKSVVGLLGLGTTAWLSWRYTPLPIVVTAWRSDYATGTGERQEITLADGSRVWLNTNTALQVNYSDATRNLVLLAGEILIETNRDTESRPFFVHTPSGRLEALGTRFTVQLCDQQTRLDVFDGAVQIVTRSGEQRVIDTGEAASFNNNTLTLLPSADRLRAAWSNGVLPADDMRLGDLLIELNRYRHGHISVAPEVANLSVMGVFPVDDTDRALEMLMQALPIRIHRPLPWWITVDAR